MFGLEKLGLKFIASEDSLVALRSPIIFNVLGRRASNDLEGPRLGRN